VNFGMDVKDLDIKKSAEHFVTIQTFAPVAKETEGKFSATFKMNSLLSPKMMPEYESINANGHLSLKNFVVKKLAILTKIAEKLKIDKYKEISLNNAEIDFEIIKGRIYVKPFTISPFDSKMTVSGSNGLDQTIDYLAKFEIPSSQFGANAESVIGSLTNKISSTGLKVKPMDKVSIVLAITGTFDNPEVKPIISAKDAVDDFKQQVEDKVNQELDKKKQELEQKKQELEKKAKEELDKKKQELEQKVKEEADKKKKEAEEKLKKEGEKQLKDKLKKLF
jgi:septin family protein